MTEEHTTGHTAARTMSAEEHLAVPYVLEVSSVRRADGEWIRRAEFPELPGCCAESPSTLRAIDEAERKREEHILDALARGEHIPVPRQPLRA